MIKYNVDPTKAQEYSQNILKHVKIQMEIRTDADEDGKYKENKSKKKFTGELL